MLGYDEGIVRCLDINLPAYCHKQSDLSDVAVPSTISSILSGKRELNVNHIKALARKYNVPAHYFIDEFVS